MGAESEAKALREVRGRLEERFPKLHPDVVAAAVQLAHSELTGPVRDFVPVLVEHAARERLSFADPEGDVHAARESSRPSSADEPA